jgi:hypothetical protein
VFFFVYALLSLQLPVATRMYAEGMHSGEIVKQGGDGNSSAAGGGVDVAASAAAAAAAAGGADVVIAEPTVEDELNNIFGQEIMAQDLHLQLGQSINASACSSAGASAGASAGTSASASAGAGSGVSVQAPGSQHNGSGGYRSGMLNDNDGSLNLGSVTGFDENSLSALLETSL